MVKVKLNLSIEQEIKDKLQQQAKSKGLNISSYITTLVNAEHEFKQITINESYRLKSNEDVCSYSNCDGITELVEHTQEGSKWVCRKCRNIEII